MSDISRNHRVLIQVLKDYQIASGQVLRQMTSFDRIRDQRALENSRKFLGKHFPSLGVDIIDIFLDLKQSPKPVIEVYGEHSDLVFLSELELKLIFRNSRVRGAGGQPDRKDGWQQFREIHPRSKGILEVSRPAYSADGMECLIEVGQQFDWLAGSGAACHYILEGVEWTSAAQVGTWIS